MYFSVEQHGSNLYIRDEQGNRVVKDFSPCLYIPSNEDSTFKSFFGKNLTERKFKNISSAKQYIQKYDDVEDFEIHGNQNFNIQYIESEYSDEYDFSKIRYFVIDIEVLSGRDDGFPSPDDALHPITTITIYDSYNGWVQWGLKEYSSKPDSVYKQFSSEKELLSDFLHYWNNNFPHIVTSWNGDTFDIPYIVNRTENILNKESVLLLSPFKKVLDREIRGNYGNIQKIYQILGIQQLDYLALYKKFTYKMQPNYRLDTIGEIECGINKLDFGEDANFNDLYENNFQRYLDYNRQDVEIIIQLNNKLNLLELAVDLAYSAGTNYSDVFSPIRLWDSIIYKELKRSNVFVPLNTKNKHVDYPGGFVREPIHGLQGWTMSFDLNSLYPSIIRGWNLGPETIIDERKDKFTFKDILDGKEFDKSGSHAANGYTYKNDYPSLYSKLMKKFYAKRKADKRKMIEYEKELEKIKEELNKRNLSE